VPDILVRNIDEVVADRIKAIARDKQWSINEVILQLLRQGLGFSDDDVLHRETQDIALLAGAWDARETAAFRSAIEAFEERDEHSLFPEPPPSAADQPPK
jgi:hypothetical protein